MNPQCGYYQNGQGNYTQFNQNQQQGYAGGSGAAGRYGNRLGGRVCASTTRMPPNRMRSTYGYGSGNQGSSCRAPPTFPSRSPANSCGSDYKGYPLQAQQNSWSGNGNGNGFRQQQQAGPKPIPFCGNNYKMAYQQPQQCSNQHPLAPAPFCTPQAIKVNVTAEQLENAKTTPYQDRGEPSVEGNPGAKYIQLNWQDLLGGMDNLRVSMVPSGDPNNPNQQLKVSFGGQKTDPPHAGETNLKVLSFEPVNTGRMDLQKGNALAGSMKVCNSPVTTISPTPSSCPPRTQAYGGGNYRQSGYGYRQ